MNKFVLFLASLAAISRTSLGADVIYVAEEQLLRVTIVQSNGSLQPFANGVGLVYGLALDSQGNVYAAGAGDDTIRKAMPDGTVSIYASSLNLGSPSGLAFDPAGNLFTTGYGWSGTVNRIGTNGAITRMVTGIGGFGLAFDTNQNLYVAAGNRVMKIATNGTTTTFAAGFNFTWGLAFDRQGNLFVADAFADSVSKVRPDGTVSLFATALDYPTGLAFDSSGNLFVCSITHSHPLGHLSKITPDGTVSTFATGLNYPTAIAIQAQGPVAPTNNAPVAQCTDVIVSAANDCFAAASVDSGSFDPDGDAITIIQTPPGPYPVGTDAVVLTVTDIRGASNSCSATVIVQDRMPPEIISAAASPAVLWPPNHQMVAIHVSARVTDSCSAATWKITDVRSNEPMNGPGDGNTSSDWAITGNHALTLRAERSGGGEGRIYSITIEATDAAGNRSESQVVTVTVPKSQGRSK